MLVSIRTYYIPHVHNLPRCHLRRDCDALDLIALRLACRLLRKKGNHNKPVFDGLSMCLQIKHKDTYTLSKIVRVVHTPQI